MLRIRCPDRRVIEKRIARLLVLQSQPVGDVRDRRIAHVLAKLRRDGYAAAGTCAVREGAAWREGAVSRTQTGGWRRPTSRLTAPWRSLASVLTYSRKSGAICVGAASRST